MKSQKRESRKYIKRLLLQADIAGIEVTYKNDSIVFIQEEKDIGYIGTTFVSGKFSDFGSRLGLFVSCRFGEEMSGTCRITEVVRQLELSYKSKSILPDSFFGFTSLSYLSCSFFNGTASFYEHEDILEKCKDISSRIQSLYLPKALNFIHHNDDLIEDIIRAPENYAYPMAYILTTCYLNNKQEDIEAILLRAKTKKMHDNKQSKIQEVRLKLDRHFGLSY